MSEYKNAPQIRFKDFDDAWEQRKLEDFGKATGGTSIESEFSENGIYKVISIGSYSENSKYNDQGIRAILSDKTKEKILNKSDLTMILNDKTANGRIIGRVLYIDKSGTYVYNQRTERIEIYKEYFEPIFIYQLLNAPQIRNKIIKQSQGNTQIFVNWNGIKNTDYLVPNKTEQVKLGELFTNLDNLITLHQRKYDNLVNVKKSLLEKMFPKNSSNIPEIRFKGFTDAWEQRKLEDITQIVMGQSPDSINYTENSDDTVLIQGNADLNNGIVVPRIWSSQITKKSYPNDIIFTVRAPVGEIARNPYFATIGRGVASFKGNDFLYQSLIQKKENNYWNNISAGSTFDSINSDQLKNVIIDLPKNNLEQEKIGELFTNLDNLITLHQRKQEKLNELKKSMLDKMFI